MRSITAVPVANLRRASQRAMEVSSVHCPGASRKGPLPIMSVIGLKLRGICISQDLFNSPV